MVKRYLPLEVLEQATVPKALEEKARSQDPLTADFLAGHENSLNLDAFLSWMMGTSFMKKAYDGPYEAFNNLLLRLYHTRDAKKDIPYAESRDQFRKICALRGILTCWGVERQAYKFDPDFAEELMATTSVDVPVEVLRHLPFRCFYLDLEYLPFAPTLGLYAYVGFEPDGSPNLGTLEVIPPKKGDDQYQLGPMLFSARELTQQGRLHQTDQGPVLTFHKDDLPESHRGSLLLFLLQAILYLSSEKPDVTEQVKREVRVTEGTRKGKAPLGITEVGVRYGKVIRKGKKQTAPRYVAAEKKPETARHVVRSHVRSAHWHHYWTGKGRKNLIVKWIPPVFVNGRGDLPVTIHPVQKGKEE